MSVSMTRGRLSALIGWLVIALGAVVVWPLAARVEAACNAEDHTQYVVGLEQVDDNDPLAPANRMYSLCADGDQRHEDVTYEIKITPPVDGDGIPLTVTATIDGGGTTADVKFSDGTTEKIGLEDGDTVTLETQDTAEGTYGTWKLRIDADNVLEGTDDPDCHASVNEYVIRPDVLTVESGRNPDNNKTDSTRTDSLPEDNTLYLCQSSDGVATAKTDLTWLPSELNLHLGLWKIVDKASGELASNWNPAPPKGQFSSEGKVVAVWTDPGGEPNREFKLMAGFDCNKNDDLDDGESRRMLQITIIRVDLEKCPATFEPKGGTEDNLVQIKAKVTPDTVKGSFKFTLPGADVSDEPGFCLNAPKTIAGPEDTETWKDLQFLQSQSGFTISGANNDVAETTANNLSDATVTVKCFDYGAYGKIKVEFTTQDGSLTCIGREEGGTKEHTNIPLDDDDNHIWDNWTYTSAGGESDDNDKNTHGAVWGMPGDGLSRYEEWRGIFYNYSALHHRLDPEVKDVIVHNVDYIWGLFGANAFGAVAKIKVAPVLDVYDGNRVINFHHETAHVVDQHVIKLERADLGGTWAWGMNVGAGGTPEEGGMPVVDDEQVIDDCKYRDNDFLKHAVGHELCHGIGGKHGIGTDHYPKYSGPTDCIMRVPTEDCEAAGSSEADWNAIPLGTTWSCAWDQKVSDIY